MDMDDSQSRSYFMNTEFLNVKYQQTSWAKVTIYSGRPITHAFARQTRFEQTATATTTAPEPHLAAIETL